MLSRFRLTLERRQALAFLKNVTSWRHTCDQLIALFQRALYDDVMPGGDIGVALDKADRLLVLLRNCLV